MSDAEVQALERHVAACAACQRRLEQLTRSPLALLQYPGRGWREVGVPPLDPHEVDTVKLARPSLDELVAKYFGPPTPLVCVDFGALSHPGKVRPNNEDHYAVVRRRRSRDLLLSNLPEGFLPTAQDEAYTLTVADGVGGAAFGEVASRMVFSVAWHLTGSAFKWSFQLTEKELAELSEVLWVYAQLIHRQLHEQGATDPRLAGMATTATSVISAGFDALVGHVGDSRAYLFRSGELKRLTRDHTLAQQLVDEGVLRSLADATSSLRAVLTNCLGGDYNQVQVETYPLRLADGDRLLLCTDGLTDMVSEQEIAQALADHADPQESCRVLVDLALDHGGKDNITIVLARYTAAAS
jgi:serine/threonine protein phosphatase PrpC